MSMIFVKSLLSLILLFSTLTALFTMFEVFGRKERRFDVGKLKSVHRLNGIVFFALLAVVSVLCLNFLYQTRAELSPRGALHALLSLTVISIFALKMALVKVYRQYYEKVQNLGIILALLTLIMIGISGGFYFLSLAY